MLIGQKFNKRSVTPSPMATQAPMEIITQKYDNLLVMIQQERKALLTGPTVTIHVGKHAINRVPKRAIMAASWKLNKHFTNNPKSSQYTYKDETLDPNAVYMLLVTWLNATCQGFEAHVVPFQSTFDRDIAVLRAAHVLGMDRYVLHIQHYYVEYLKTCLATYHEIVVLTKYTVSDREPLWVNLVNHLCYLRHRGLIPDPMEFGIYLEKNERLNKSMAEADKFFKHRQHARKMQQCEEYAKRAENGPIQKK
ncbi:hypothetical protein IQ07DRAFT_669422 [Pyrenochaeta sp. DS3sAY3a]|nr:hypothetical protein IQ07DRAFT_669422 [Pyrenochaeta sp. DS3sAY3a]